MEELRFYSQNGQDKFLYETYFKDIRNGVFLDVGAYDGKTFSNSYFFEKELGWNGLCIEPIKKAFDRLVELRKCVCINGAVVNDSSIETVEFNKLSENLEMLSGVLKMTDSRHFKRLEREFELHGGDKEIITVDAYYLPDVLDKYGISKIDYMSIDIEGGELDILKTLDLNKYDIRIIGVENNYAENIFKEYFQDNYSNYSYIKTVGADDIFVKN